MLTRVCVCISACDGSLSISSSHMTPVTHHTPRRSRNKPAITRQTGETEIPAPHRGLQQQTDTVQTDNPAKSSAAARSLPAVLMRGNRKSAAERFVSGRTHRDTVKPPQIEPRDRARRSRRSNNSATSSRGGPAASWRTRERARTGRGIRVHDRRLSA